MPSTTPFTARARTTRAGNNNNKDQGGHNNNNYSGPNRKRKPDNTVAAIQRPAKDNSKKSSSGFKDLLKEKCPWHLDDNHTPSSATSSGEHSRTLPTHGLVMTIRARKKSMKAMATFRNPTRW
jgi:flagellar hook-basal body complex protein FliE